MKFTDIFVRRPVLALVVNLLIIIAGLQAIRSSNHFQLVITPEGTRKKVDKWKMGFYHIAKQANIPVVTGFVDSATRTCGIGPTFTLSDDMEADIESIQAFFKDKVGIIPESTSEM